MNLVQFLKQIDELTASCEKAQLAAFIHDRARLLKENGREEFLAELKNTVQKEPKLSDGRTSRKDILKEYEKITAALERIEEEELGLEEEYNEEYDDWYNNTVDEVFYRDPDHILDVVEDLCRFVHKCTDQEYYREGVKAGERLFSLTIRNYGDFGGEEISVKELEEKNLLKTDLKRLLLDTLYCVWQAVPVEERSDRLYEIILNSRIKNLRMEDLMQHGGELQDFDEFLELWIDYLGRQSGSMAEKLFEEAIALTGDLEKAAAVAGKCVSVHPGIFLRVLDGDWKAAEKKMSARERDQKMLEIGLTALELIDSRYVIRSETALKTAEYAKQLGEKEAAGKCYLESFRSGTNAVNYLRALLNCESSEETEKMREALRDICENVSAGATDWGAAVAAAPELKENVPTKRMAYALEFLDGRFTQVSTKRMNKKEALGWTGTFMKEGFALFMLYLYQGKELTPGIRQMLAEARQALAFTAEDYIKGLCMEKPESEDVLFQECFLKWKSITPMEEADAVKIIRKLEKTLENRVEGIMSANRRNYYGECAAFIAALGEVKESRGEANGKQRYMTSYKEKYPRRSAFRAEMKAFGWRG